MASRAQCKSAYHDTFHEGYDVSDQVLGTGASSTVLSCTHRKSGIEYAAKAIEKRLDQDDSRERMNRVHAKVCKEIDIYTLCRGQSNVLQLIDSFETPVKYILVFEKMRGGTLLDAVRTRGHLTERDAADVTRQIATAISFLHMHGIAHRDLKPENVLCTYPGRLDSVKICDFDLGSQMPYTRGKSGSNRWTSNSREVQAQLKYDRTPKYLTPVGSLEYMAPEVVDAWLGDAGSYNKKCDCWSLGVILYILLCGYPPFTGGCGPDCGWDRGDSCNLCQIRVCEKIQKGHFDYPKSDWSKISCSARDLVSNLLRREPDRRYSADQVLAHPWIVHCGCVPEDKSGGESNELDSPRILEKTQGSLVESALVSEANMIQRMLVLGDQEEAECAQKRRAQVMEASGSVDSGAQQDEDLLNDYDWPYRMTPTAKPKPEKTSTPRAIGKPNTLALETKQRQRTSTERSADETIFKFDDSPISSPSTDSAYNSNSGSGSGSGGMSDAPLSLPSLTDESPGRARHYEQGAFIEPDDNAVFMPSGGYLYPRMDIIPTLAAPAHSLLPNQSQNSNLTTTSAAPTPSRFTTFSRQPAAAGKCAQGFLTDALHARSALAALKPAAAPPSQGACGQGVQATLEINPEEALLFKSAATQTSNQVLALANGFGFGVPSSAHIDWAELNEIDNIYRVTPPAAPAQAPASCKSHLNDWAEQQNQSSNLPTNGGGGGSCKTRHYDWAELNEMDNMPWDDMFDENEFKDPGLVEIARR